MYSYVAVPMCDDLFIHMQRMLYGNVQLVSQLPYICHPVTSHISGMVHGDRVRLYVWHTTR